MPSYYDPQDANGVTSPPAPFDSTLPVVDFSGAGNDQFNSLIQLTHWCQWGNAPVPQWLLAQWSILISKMAQEDPVPEIIQAVSEITFAAQNNAPIMPGSIVLLNDAYSQFVYGVDTTDPGDLQAINQLTNAILAQEPDWAPNLWINWVLSDGALITQNRALYTLSTQITETPWWTHWDNFYDAACELIATIYLMAMAQQAGMTMEANNAQSRDSSACSSC